MLKNHLRFAWRSLTRHKGYTLINILGLALGLCACISIYTITHYEFSFDDFHPDKDRIYRIGCKVGENKSSQYASEFYTENIPPPEPDLIRAAVPGIETVAAYYRFGDTTIITTNDYFRILPYEWLAGNASTALSIPGSVVLTESQALKQFGHLPPDACLGKPLTLFDSLHLHVTGIIRDWTGNTDFPHTRFISFSTIEHSFLHDRFRPEEWAPRYPWVRTLIKVKPAARLSQIETQVAATLPRHLAGSVSNIFDISLVLQPLADIHFNEDFSHDGARKVHLPALYGLMGVAVFILLLAIVNFINLSTAQSLRRAKEMAVRKVLGGSKFQLTLRFLTETALITILAAILATAFTQPVLTLFHSYIFEGIHFHPLASQTLLFITSVVTITTLLAGFYPARVLAGYSPTLTGNTTPKDHLRKGLIVFQFTISAIFVIGSITVGRQLHYMLDADMGIATNAVITVDNDNAENLRRFATDISHIPGIKDWTLESYPPAARATIERPVQLDGKKQTEMFVRLQGADHDFLSFYHLPLLAGHNFPAGDSLNGFLINAAYCRSLGFSHPADAIGHSLSINGAPSWPITGVVADFHQGSFHDRIIPVIIGHFPDIENSLAIRLEKTTAIERLQSAWKTIIHDKPFSYTFLDESIRRLYESDRQLGWLVNAATAITIFISCMGLLGLATFTAEQRKKEIAIRKVLGANVATIALLLTKDFLRLIGIATMIAMPIAAYSIHRWLENYAYHISVSAWIFVFAALTLLGITLGTIAFRVIGAARQNPINNLRSE